MTKVLSYMSDTATGYLTGIATCFVKAAAYTEARTNLGPIGQCRNTISDGAIEVRQECLYNVAASHWIWSMGRGYISFDTSVIGSASLLGASLFISAQNDADETAGSDLSNVIAYNYDSDADLCGAASEANYDGAYGGAAVLEGTILDTTGGSIENDYWYNMEVSTSNINPSGSTTYTLVCQADVDNDSSLSSIGILAFYSGTATGRWPHLQLDIPGGYAWIF